MPPYTRGQLRERITYVKLDDVGNLYYGFKTKDLTTVAGVSAADIAALGHLADVDVPDTGIRIFAANQPKPPRVGRKIASTGNTQTTVSTFSSGTNAVIAALPTGWRKIKSGTRARTGSSPRTVVVLAELSNGARYAFRLNVADFATYGTDLGLVDSSTVTTPAERASIFTGSSFPKPGKASLITANNTLFQTFYSTASRTAAGAAGFSLTDEVLR